jgi:hypothetical protein
MDSAPLPGGAEHLGDRVLEPLVRVRDHQPHALQATADQPFEERRPEGFRLRGAKADDLAPPVAVDRHGDDRRHRDDPATVADLQVWRIQPEIGPRALQRPLQEGVDALVPPHAARRVGTPASMSLHSLLTVLLEMPASPIA